MLQLKLFASGYSDTPRHAFSCTTSKKTYHVGIIIVWYYKFFKRISDFENNQVFLHLGHVLTFLTVARKAQWNHSPTEVKILSTSVSQGLVFVYFNQTQWNTGVLLSKSLGIRHAQTAHGSASHWIFSLHTALQLNWEYICVLMNRWMKWVKLGWEMPHIYR